MINMKIFKIRDNIFEKARLMLTFYYVLIMFLIIIIFSGAFMYAVDAKLRETFDNQIIVTETEDPIQNFSYNIKIILYTIDSILLLVVTVGSYFLAGRTLRPIKDSMESQKRFLNDVSHDLRTPLAIMTTSSEVSLSDKNINLIDMKEVVKDNLDEIKKMSKMVTDLLLVARGERIGKSFININLSELVINVSKKFEKITLKKGLVLDTDIKNDIYLYCNQSEIERVLQNLLKNSVNYTNKGSIKVSLFKDIHNAINLDIEDTGVGIDKKDMPFVFDRFYKAEHSRHDNSGSGLGLSICKNIIENHNGSIKIESTKNVGTKVSIIYKYEK